VSDTHTLGASFVCTTEKHLQFSLVSETNRSPSSIFEVLSYLQMYSQELDFLASIVMNLVYLVN